ncbi:hypothetical protein BDV28DRAFT_142483 [Aspergillus coremiiformis]|uniref:GPI anchored serine-rich protein n=1 Tax=Aspergillus coremiiformis TaxID=138285 RepID=A0A5N6YTS3_9EURO|nr:hypothetical protein BDV28DRAFT_142483 [Aspergillus coremiiformis]
MRFSASTIVLFAGLAAAIPNGDVHTVYQTEDVTITSCAPTVTDCPARQTSTPHGVEPVTTPAAATPTAQVPSAGETTPDETSPSDETSPDETSPYDEASSSPVAPAIPTGSSPVAPPQVPSGSVPAVPSGSSPVIPQQPGVSVIAVTTCIPTVIYSTITGTGAGSGVTGVSPGRTSSAPLIGSAYPSGSAHPSGYYPSGSATPSSSSPSALFTGAANTVGNSFGLAGAAAAAAFFLA